MTPPLSASPSSDHEGLFRLPRGYRENPPASADSSGTPFWGHGSPRSDERLQAPVYRWAARIVGRGDVHVVVDVGCGIARKLIDNLATRAAVVGVDQESAIRDARIAYPLTPFISGDLDDSSVWERAVAHNPDLVLCVDVIEHVPDPSTLLDRLAELCGRSGRLLLSTPDRARLEQSPPLGPPQNPRHVREWAAPELEALLADHGLIVLERRHLLPRSYSVTAAELRRFAGRARRRLPLPDSRSCLAVLAEPARR